MHAHVTWSRRAAGTYYYAISMELTKLCGVLTKCFDNVGVETLDELLGNIKERYAAW